MDQAITNAVKKLAKEGLDKVEYPTGAKRSVEAAVSVAVRTSVAQNALQCEEDMLNEMDVNLVETSSHMGARPSHAEWQGKVFWRNYPEGNYENFYQATGYGTATGLGGYNCRYQFYAFFGEDDEETYEHIDETVNKQAYEMEQKQRSLERKIREWDRKKKILEAGGQDTTEAKKWKRYYQEQIKNLVDSSEGFLKRNYSAEKAYNTTPTSQKVSEVAQHKKGVKVDITEQAIDKVKDEAPKSYTTEQKYFTQGLRKALLYYSQQHNNSNEVGCVLNPSKLEASNYVKGLQDSVNLNSDTTANHMLLTAEKQSLEVIHNHPWLSYFSLADIAYFLKWDSIETLTIITNQGKIWYLRKTENFNRQDAYKKLAELSANHTGDELVAKFLKNSNNVGIERN